MLRHLAMLLPLIGPSAALAQTTQITPDEQGLGRFWSDSGLRVTFHDTPWWGWMALAGCIFAGLAAGRTIRLISERSARVNGERNRPIRQAISASIARPASLASCTMGLLIGMRFIVLSPELSLVVRRAGAFLLIAAIGWCLYNLVSVIELLLKRITSKTRSPLDDQLVPLVRKTLRILLVVILSLFIADNIFGANISSFLAGLGIVGLAISLASQDTVKNFFGSVTIFVDQPFNLGDRIVLTGYDGVVEEIGFRSTKLRTGNGHIVQIPNSKIVDSTVENISRRPFLRRSFDVPLPANALPAQIEQAVQLVQQVLGDPEIAAGFDLQANPPRVSLEDLPAPGARPVLKVHYWFTPADPVEFARHAQKLNLILMQRLSAAGMV